MAGRHVHAGTYVLVPCPGNASTAPLTTVPRWLSTSESNEPQSAARAPLCPRTAAVLRNPVAHFWSCGFVALSECVRVCVMSEGGEGGGALRWTKPGNDPSARRPTFFFLPARPALNKSSRLSSCFG